MVQSLVGQACEGPRRWVGHTLGLDNTLVRISHWMEYSLAWTLACGGWQRGLVIVEVQPAPAGVGVFVRGIPEDAQAKYAKEKPQGTDEEFQDEQVSAIG